MSGADALVRLAHAGWLHRVETQAVFKLLDGVHGRVRVVGGSVRDTLMGLDDGRGDVDFATEFLPDEVMARAKAAGIKAVPTGIEHGTVTLVIDGRGHEVTTLRQDKETDGRRAIVAFGTDWAVDAARRDFTFNALYAEWDGKLYDPLGGLDDTLAGRVRFIGDADKRIEEDRLRVFRFYRFSASHGKQVFDAEGLAACTRAAGTLGDLSAERVGHEMMRMLELRAVATTLAAMEKAEVLDLGADCLTDMVDYERRAELPMAMARLALMLEHEEPKVLQERWRLSKAQLVGAQAIGVAAKLISEGAVLEAAYRYGDVAQDAVAVAGILGDWDIKLQARVSAQLADIQVPDFPVSGSDLLTLGVAQGPELGEILKLLEQDWIASGFKLSRTELLRRFTH